MSIAQHHNEWLSLLEINGPFLGLKSLTTVFPQGLDALDSEVIGRLREDYEEWADNQRGLQADPALHIVWVRHVLRQLLGLDDRGVLDVRGDCPAEWRVTTAEHEEPLRPDWVVKHPQESEARLLIQVVPERQGLEKRLKHEGRPINTIDPATRMMTLLRGSGVPLGLLTNGEAWMLVYAPAGENATFVTWQAHLWFEERLTLRAFYSLLGGQRFFNVPPEERLPQLLAEGVHEQHDVTDQLGRQVRQAVEILVQTLARVDQDAQGALLADVSEGDLYEAALTVMMRLVFLLSAEARGLLLLGDPIYDQHYAVSTLRGQLREAADAIGEEIIERRPDAWARLLATFRAVYGGIWHEDLRLPAYGGSLFNPDRFPFLEGRRRGEQTAKPPAIDNRTVLHLLEALQLLQFKVGGVTTQRTLSFAALDIEQIGHVYEGLLDHRAERATEVVLGLDGPKEPEIRLSQLETWQTEGGGKLEKSLKERTGRSSTKTIQRGLAQRDAIDTLGQQRLLAACGNDNALYQRVLPFYGLLRHDTRQRPLVILPGEVFVTAGTDRRASGTHYTPRSLTEPVVRHTLEPLVYEGPAGGWLEPEWRLKTADELLSLTVCDMAMGSGAFLVQACRYLAEHLVRSINRPEFAHRYPPLGHPLSQLAHTPDPDEQFLIAKRLVADRCLYGVDKNRLAVEMGKLSLWLITLDKNRPFTFVDHALRHGDALVGASEEQFLRWPHSLQSSSMPLFDQEVGDLVARARQKRQELRSFEVRDVRDAARKRELLAEAEAETARIRYGCDLLVGVHFLPKLKTKARNGVLAEAVAPFNAGDPFADPWAVEAVKQAQGQRAFHWHFEFPEVFAKGGFDAFVGNPPFIGGQRIRGAMGENYLHYLKTTWNHAKGSADYSAYFFLRAFAQLQQAGNLGLIATNTIAQGATLEIGLDHIYEQMGEIYCAHNDFPWPGKAAVVVDIVHIHKGKFVGQKLLDDEVVKNITPQLDDMKIYGKPYTLMANENKSFQGSNILGLGFTMSPSDAKEHIDRNSQNKNVLFPYLNGQDLNSHPEQKPSRWVINFRDWPLERTAEGSWQNADDKQRKKWLQHGRVPIDYIEPVTTDYPDLLGIVRDEVYPFRRANANKQRREIWWRFTRPTIELYETIAPLGRVLAIALTSKTAAFASIKSNIVFSHAVGVIAFETFAEFATLQSTIHIEWAWKYGSSLKGDLRYTPSDIFETYPFPSNVSVLESIGHEYHSYRQTIMQENNEGLTKTYNRFHDPAERRTGIAHLRRLHVAMDEAVAAAYGWSDLPLGHGFHDTAQGVRYTISDTARREVLGRLLALNHERYAAEQEEEKAEGERRKAEKTAKGKREKGKGKKEKKNDGQMSLF